MDISPARRDLHKILGKMNLISIKMDEAITSSTSSPDIAIELHASQEDIEISEVEGGSRKDGRQVGKVLAVVRKEKPR